MQIRARLTLLFFLLAAGILAAVLFAVYWLFKINTEEAFYKSLSSKVELTVQTVLSKEATLMPLPNDWLAPEGDTLPYSENVSIFDNSYHRVFTLLRESVPISAKNLQEIYQKEEVRFKHFNLHALGVKVNTPLTQYVVVAEGYCDPSAIRKLRNILIFSFFMGIFLVTFTGWFYAGKALQPMSAIVHAVERIQPSDLSKRVEAGNSRDELAHLTETFNNLLDRVEQAFQMQKMFVSNLSHELKNPLTAIRAQLDVVLQRERSNEVYRNALQSVLEDIKDLSEMEQKLLYLARVYNSPQTILFTPIRLDELLWQTMEQFQKQYPNYRASIECSEMPTSGDGLVVSANEPLLRLSLLNLMNNACKYSPDHAVLVRAIFQPDRKHIIAVCDNGPGIPDAEKLLIFEPFYRSPRHLKVKGTGIGLSLVKRILDLHNIQLDVENTPSGGAVFRLLFP
jgi:signal transduction histidine kinase